MVIVQGRRWRFLRQARVSGFGFQKAISGTGDQGHLPDLPSISAKLIEVKAAAHASA
ncbi:hypothetical protein [Maritimibacter sp. 55A14]|uniref:hypothetical protein n=1 Tax=Maritimibacter sp. 55A14 TaxID=2174844 RepID=UPI0013048E68|nr:hypothetical protein [Maritimibacter sp. 55A14]